MLNNLFEMKFIAHNKKTGQPIPPNQLDWVYLGNGYWDLSYQGQPLLAKGDVVLIPQREEKEDEA